jgi:hypothetical protein
MLCTPAQLFHHYNKPKLRICLFKKKETENLLDDGGLLLFFDTQTVGEFPTTPHISKREDKGTKGDD